MKIVPAYTPDKMISEPADVILEHIIVALSLEEQLLIAERLRRHLRAPILREKTTPVPSAAVAYSRSQL